MRLQKIKCSSLDSLKEHTQEINSVVTHNILEILNAMYLKIKV